MKIYIDADFKCHLENDGTFTPIETDAFGGKCQKYIEGYRFVPAGETWTREDGVEFQGEMISPHTDYAVLAAYQEQYEESSAELQDAEAAMAVFGFSTQAEAEAMKPAVSMAVQRLHDAKALTVKPLYPVWEDLVKLGTVKTDEVGYKFTYNGDLYKCRNANPQFQETWIPGTDTAALYTRIDETHTGTEDDPIPYSGNMELVSGLYYSQDGIVYRCTRDTGIPVYHPLKDLVGIYVEVVT